MKGNLLIVVSAVSYGFMGIFARLAYSSGVGVIELLLLSLILSFATIGVMLLSKGQPLRPTKRQFLSLFALGGIAYSLQSGLLLLSLLYIPVSIAVLVFYTYPALVSVISIALRWELVSRKRLDLAGSGINRALARRKS